MVRTTGLRGYSDVHFTSAALAKAIVQHFSPTGRCLEPFLGAGAFFDALPDGCAWCEISQGRDFFAFNEQVDWIITNPPFSNLTEIFAHAFNISADCVFLIPISKYWSSAPRLALAHTYGGLKEIVHVGPGRAIGFDIGFPFAAMHFQRGYKGPILQTILETTRPLSIAS
jgi:hypothetical protein